MQAVYIDIHIHTSENPNNPNQNYDVKQLIKRISVMSKGHPVLISLSDHNMLNKKAYKELCALCPHVLLGAEIHISKYETAPPYHCHIVFNCEATEENIDAINSILDKLYPDKVVTKETENIPDIEKISNEFDNFDYILLPHGGQSHRTFDQATASGHRFDTSMERSIYYNQFEGFTARSNSGIENTVAYFQRLGIDQFTNLITCSDNYKPEIYPSAKDKEAEDFVPTWMLSEPTFEGFKLALSEKSRLCYGIDPPEKWGQSIYDVKLDSEKCKINVSMTPGLNVVIGGSSSGKTLFVDSIVRKMKNDFSNNCYSKYGVENIIVNNPSGVVPHYINQNFIISVLQSEDKDLGDIELINEVFPEDKVVTERIRKGLAKLKKLIEELFDSVAKYEKNIQQLTHIPNPAGLIISKEIPQRIAEMIKPSVEEKGRFSYSRSDYSSHIEYLQDIENVFIKSSLDIPYKEELETLRLGLRFIFQLSELSEIVSSAIDSSIEKEFISIAEDDQENSRKIELRSKLCKCVSELIGALSDFYRIKDELSRFNIQATTKEIDVGGHLLSIQNSFELTKRVLTDSINTFLKAEKRIKDFSELTPETLFKDGFKEKPKLKGYEDFAQKVYSSISEKNRKTYHITTEDGRDFMSLSPGWKTAVILDLLLAYNGDVAPMIIDQPEDNLATNYINHDLVNLIKRVKPKKQIILVSHNATIPMLGDAQNVIVCKNEDGIIRIESAALESSINGQRVLDSIASITDGGKASIRKRVKKYDLKKYREERKKDENIISKE